MASIENNDLGEKVMWGTMIILIGTMVYAMNRSSPGSRNKFYCDLQGKFDKLEFNGIILERFKDRKHHGYETIICQEKTRRTSISLFLDKSQLFNFCLVGDSISKQHGTNEVYLFRNQQKIQFETNFGCRK